MISQFIDTARNNVYASFVHLHAQFHRLSDIDAAFRLLVDHLKNPDDWFTPLFLLRAHSSFLGAVHIGLAGQLPEAYMLLRGSVENGLYAFYFHRTPNSHERWLRRHDSAVAKKVVQSEFKVRALLLILKQRDERLGVIAGDLYERTIDFGGHPNERALTQMLKLPKEEAAQQFHVNYLTGHTVGMDLCLKTAAQVGVFVLRVFEHVFPERYALIGLSERLKHLQEGL